MYPEPCRGCDGQGGRPLGTTRWQPAPALPPSRDWHLRCASQATGHLRFPGQHLEAGAKLDSGNSPGGGEVHTPRRVRTVPLAENPQGPGRSLDAVIRGSPGGRGGGRPRGGAGGGGRCPPSRPPAPFRVGFDSPLGHPARNQKSLEPRPRRLHFPAPAFGVVAAHETVSRKSETCGSGAPARPGGRGCPGGGVHVPRSPGRGAQAESAPRWLVTSSSRGAVTCLRPGGAHPPCVPERHLARERPWVLRRKAKLQAERRKPHL